MVNVDKLIEELSAFRFSCKSAIEEQAVIRGEEIGVIVGALKMAMIHYKWKK
jgi:hypothetical protein